MSTLSEILKDAEYLFDLDEEDSYHINTLCLSNLTKLMELLSIIKDSTYSLEEAPLCFRETFEGFIRCILSRIPREKLKIIQCDGCSQCVTLDHFKAVIDRPLAEEVPQNFFEYAARVPPQNFFEYTAEQASRNPSEYTQEEYHDLEEESRLECLVREAAKFYLEDSPHFNLVEMKKILDIYKRNKSRIKSSFYLSCNPSYELKNLKDGTVDHMLLQGLWRSFRSTGYHRYEIFEAAIISTLLFHFDHYDLSQITITPTKSARKR